MLTNIETDILAIFENIIKIIALKKEFGKYFNILLPVIPYTNTLMSAALYKKILFKNQVQQLHLNFKFEYQDFPEFNYYYYDKDLPKNKLVEKMAKIARLYIKDNNINTWTEYLRLIYALLLKESQINKQHFQEIDNINNQLKEFNIKFK